jgi:hypothetical protein
MSFKKRFAALLLGLVCIMTVVLSGAGCSVKKQAGDEKAPESITAGNPDAGSTNTEKIVPVLAQLGGSNEIDVPFEAAQYTASVPSYRIEADLSNIANLEQFGSFTEKQKELLAKNGFVVTPTKEEQLFYIYENNEYLLAPSFITVDSVLQVYHVFYDYSLRRLEAETLTSELTALTDSMFRKSAALYESLENERLKELELKNIAYFGVAKLALGMELPLNMPDKAKQLAFQEYELMASQSGY